ncbi:tRNA epoxyqueuosine(34) reductase QueG [Lignipirellula cremea]|uniref:Epoxyqueuosine reductase n=1 Tax=Lignipirellula cremea TaxID=2528010 RepID=A0A518DP41_9BACT|nr:tRNA epoxyqueuosine(34) reductase QueG [Lignipirellula cremea]QDU93596.1 Epoxyqueuosine reductase [Lignipirellula cremea]
MNDPATITALLRAEAARLGFDLAGVCRAEAPPLERFRQWCEAGYAGQMHYLPDRWEAYQSPQSVLDGAQSMLVLTMNYSSAPAPDLLPGQGRVSRYAYGECDYHDLIHTALKQLKRYYLSLAPAGQVRGVVDTAPLLERDLAQLAGLGWRGKNTLLLNKRRGSQFFLAVLLCDEELAYDEPHQAAHCGECRACLDACPTNAFPAPYLLDATRCISYLTIELKGPIPEPLRAGIGDWMFGCDVCQDVCPWNRHAVAPALAELLPRDDLNPVNLTELFTLDDEAFRQRFRRTPLWRTKREGLLRNAAIVLGNRPGAHALAPLTRGLHDASAVVRGASAWALGQQSSPAARQLLQDQAAMETDDAVLAEIRQALAAE